MHKLLYVVRSFLVSLLLSIILISASAETRIKVPVHYYKLQNGLRVVISAEHFAPVVAVGVYYNIGS
jgi:predicted Zn-dependent peptidase